MIEKEFGLVILNLRKKNNWSQEKLAEKSNLHRTYIGMIERGEKNITLKNIYKISQAFNITISELLKDIK